MYRVLLISTGMTRRIMTRSVTVLSKYSRSMLISCMHRMHRIICIRRSVFSVCSMCVMLSLIIIRVDITLRVIVNALILSRL